MMTADKGAAGRVSGSSPVAVAGATSLSACSIDLATPNKEPSADLSSSDSGRISSYVL